MRRVALGAFLVALPALPATAQMAEIDVNSDGMASFGELTAVYDLTDDRFDGLDTDGDGFLNEEEMAAATEEGALVPLED